MKRILFVFSFLVVFGTSLKSQTIPAPEELSLSFELSTSKEIPEEVMDTLTDPMNILTASDTLIISVYMDASDTINLSKIHIKLGSTDGGSELLEQTFDYDNFNPSGDFTYERTGNTIKIGIGNFLYIQNYFCEVYFEDTSGGFSEIEKYQSN